MAVDVSNLVNLFATQPAKNIQSLGEAISSAQEYKAQKQQQEFENYRKAAADAIQNQANQAKLTESQLKGIQTRAEITAGIAGKILTAKDNLVRGQLFEESVPTLKQIGYTEDQISTARQNIGDDKFLLGKVAEGTAAKDVYNAMVTAKEAKAPTVNTYRKDNMWVTEEWNPTNQQWEEKGRSPIKEGGPVTNIYGEKPSMEFTKAAVKELSNATEQANLARKSNAAMQYGQQLLSGMETGSLSDVNLAMGKIASSLGIPYKNVGNMEAAKGAFADMVKAGLAAFPGAISEGERNYAISIAPQLTSTPEGRRKLVSFLTEVNNRAIEYQRQMDRYIAANPNMNLFPTKEGDPSFIQVWDQYVKDNPLSILSEEVKGGVAPEEWNTSPQRVRMPDGKEYRNIGGKWKDVMGKEYKGGK